VVPWQVRVHSGTPSVACLLTTICHRCFVDVRWFRYTPAQTQSKSKGIPKVLQNSLGKCVTVKVQEYSTM
jgi:hypothetical protein